jgi:hypothetical protein
MRAVVVGVVGAMTLVAAWLAFADEPNPAVPDAPATERRDVAPIEPAASRLRIDEPARNEATVGTPSPVAPRADRPRGRAPTERETLLATRGYRAIQKASLEQVRRLQNATSTADVERLYSEHLSAALAPIQLAMLARGDVFVTEMGHTLPSDDKFYYPNYASLPGGVQLNFEIDLDVHPHVRGLLEACEQARGNVDAQRAASWNEQPFDVRKSRIEAATAARRAAGEHGAAFGALLARGTPLDAPEARRLADAMSALGGPHNDVPYVYDRTTFETRAAPQRRR